jgi:hypothetical protein
MQCERIRKLISRWHRDELGAERMAARRKCFESGNDSRHYPQERGARFAEGGGRFTGMPRMTLHLRYRTWKLRALCWVLRRVQGAPLLKKGWAWCFRPSPVSASSSQWQTKPFRYGTPAGMP